VRDKENLNALNGLDEPLTPLNMSTDAEGKSKVINFAPIGDRMAVINHLRLLASDAASRIIRKEQAAMARLAERTGTDTAAFRAGVDTFYDTHGREVAETLHIPEPEARRYARSQRAALLADGPSAMDDWIVDRADYLAKLAMNQPELATAA
jgi:hypothetical protein